MFGCLFIRLLNSDPGYKLFEFRIHPASFHEVRLMTKESGYRKAR